jgi:hypothetical protein
MGDSRAVLLESNSHGIFFVIAINNTTAIIIITIFIIGIAYFADSFLHNYCLSGKLNLAPQLILKERRV